MLYERALKIAIFREIRQAIAWPTVTNSSIIVAQSPELSGNISSSCCRVLLSITFRENTAADGMLALSLTCMIFLCEQCICCALTVFSVFFLPVNVGVFPVQLIPFLFLKHLLIVKNSKFKESRFHFWSKRLEMNYFVIVVMDCC